MGSTYPQMQNKIQPVPHMHQMPIPMLWIRENPYHHGYRTGTVRQHDYLNGLNRLRITYERRIGVPYGTVPHRYCTIPYGTVPHGTLILRSYVILSLLSPVK